MGPCLGEFETPPEEGLSVLGGHVAMLSHSCGEPFLLYIQPEFPLMEFSSPLTNFTASLGQCLLCQRSPNHMR